jgi:hypothetical protein
MKASSKRPRDCSIGGYVYGVAAIGFGLDGIARRDFALVWQPLPTIVLGRAVLACVVAAIFLIAGMALQWRKTASKCAALLGTLFSLCILLLRVPIVIAPRRSWALGRALRQLALVAGGLLAYGLTADLSPLWAERL